ncbi:uncharacterized protein BHQ10_007864 [Talaromyces amestolkiae]|uniref:CSC1/OSCA1-like 7TM region domain-containing protein n=1 Tax=Talaromyces amestolkiae TaxID=1196081 RepID=A0A364L7T0_TALAM|nr:uncharacterized protein BHQ10_007864 [Talaromyces amestolkiae]RAO71852.1 hypothetical protein BHQ10_007864 [Talaromyces amestolkiae]
MSTDLLSGSGTKGDEDQGISISTFLASLATGAIVFAIEALLFLMLKGNLRRIYQPRTYLVPDRERTKPPAPGPFGWVYAVFQTTNAEFIQKCGLDAYFFLRYLRMLLKIFVPMGLVILPILIPVNKVGGKDNNLVSNTNSTTWNVTGMDQLAWGNIKPEHTDRYWAHLVLAVLSILYVCAVFFDELRGYIRLRQAYLTSPQHRLRASATTVLVTAIPKKWLSVEALTNLYDVFPGGIRNIWINRQLDELNEKVKLRDQLALALEAAETDLIAKCKKAQMKQAKAEAKKSGKKASKEDEKQKEGTDKKAAELVMQSGISSGNPHQVAHNVQDALKKDRESKNKEARRQRKKKFLPLVGGGLTNAVGNGATVFEKKLVGGIRKANQGVGQRLENTPGFAVLPEELVSISSRGNSKEINDTKNHHDRSSFDSNKDSVNSVPEEIDQQEGYEVNSEEQTSRRPGWSRKSSANSKRGNRPPEADEIPLTEVETRESQIRPDTSNTNDSVPRKKEDGEEYPLAYDEHWQEDCGEPLWKKYIRQKDRETMRLPIFGITWMPSIPLIGKKVDTIDYCRKEVARLNLEIEIDQQHPEKFPLMNSAFIQFNHQVAAHMACQAVSHHVPKQMAPRVVEISPDDVIWDNMSMKWWERYLRSGGIFIVVCGMVAGWAIPVAFTGLLSQLSYLEGTFTWLAWLSKLPHWLFSAIQGVLPPLFLSLLMVVLPMILRFLSQTQGLQTGMAVELMVSNYYFAFLFVQLFLVVAISSSFSTLIDSVTNITGWPELLAENIPKSSNYFFSYMILRAMSVSAGALAQIVNLIKWFILGPLFDDTARNKWSRTTNLQTVRWGSFFPVYTTLACIGLIYIIVAPLIAIFIIATFALFWFVYRYNTLYVTKFRFDTGGLLFPKAINQMFTGLYVMELCLVGLFFLVRDENDRVACQGQAIVMIVVLILTLGYQYFLNEAFSPLIRYLPITLEDDAVRRDEEFARAQRIRHGLPVDDDDEDEDDLKNGHASGSRPAGYDERDFGTNQKEIELQDINRDSKDEERKNNNGHVTRNLSIMGKRVSGMTAVSWADRSRNRRSKYYGTNSGYDVPSIQKLRQQLAYEAEDEETRGTGTNPIGRALFAGIHDELEDLTPDERDQLVQRAFQHEALRAKRPVIWIPRDDLGVSDDEIYCTQRFSKHSQSA